MRLFDYLKDEIITVTVMISVTCLVMLILAVFNCPTFLVVYIPLLLISSFVVVLMYDFFRRRNFYNNLIGILDHLDEKYLITELIGNPHFLDGKIMVNCIYEIDKSMKEHLNDAIYRQSELKEYIEMWCHEVKTPVATSQMIIENNLNPVNESIKEELIKIDNYVEQVLFYARSENVEKDYLIKDVKLSELVNSVIKRNKKDLINKHVKIELENLEIDVASDKKWLEFILNQIINNAIKYVDETPIIKLFAKQYKDRVELMIKDNGIGISKENMDRIFKIYERVNDDRSIIKEGTGIGLSLVRDFAKLHHGSISVKSEVGVGSEFVVKIANTLADENEIKIHYKMTKEERLQNIAVAFSDL